VAVKRDYYEILGVGRDCSPDELKRAFRKLALQYHPDRNPDDPQAAERFKEASEAYSVLSDPEKRRSYDMFGHDGVGQGGGGGFADLDLNEIFRTIFGGGFGGGARSGFGTGTARSVRGEDLRYELTISFEEAFEGVEREIDVPRMVVCELCDGSGAEPGTSAETCDTCGGSGQVWRSGSSIFRSIMSFGTCPNCAGAGRILRTPCAGCRGQGRVQRSKRLRVRVPAGIDSRSQIRLVGEGQAGYRGASPGDLYILVRVKPHPHYRRQENDIIFELRVNMVQAALGDRILVPTLDGDVEVTIPPGTQYGQTFRLPGKGMPDVHHGRRGDQFVLVQVVVPKDLNEEQKALLRKVGGLTGRPERVSKGFFDKIREAINLD
jgi:molecular chaperone DnaJ